MLYKGFALGPITLANRIVMAPMTRARADAGDVIGDAGLDYYVQRASAGLIITEGAQISPQGRGYSGTPGIYASAQVVGWRRVTDAVHAAAG
jgi:N-ethylmaleimide reductase